MFVCVCVGYSVSVVSKYQLHFAECFRLSTNVVDHVGREADFGQTLQLPYDCLRFQTNRDSTIERGVGNDIFVDELGSGERLCNGCEEISRLDA